MATTNSTSGSKGTTKRPARKRTTTSRSPRAATTTRGRAMTDEAKAAVRSVRTRATRAAKKVPTDATSLSIAAGVLAGIVAAGIAVFMNRDRLRDAAATGGERLRQAADDLSSMAHERIDQARDNITKFRTRGTTSASEAPTTDSVTAIG